MITCRSEFRRWLKEKQAEGEKWACELWIMVLVVFGALFFAVLFRLMAGA
jgi:hypothetical protein